VPENLEAKEQIHYFFRLPPSWIALKSPAQEAPAERFNIWQSQPFGSPGTRQRWAAAPNAPWLAHPSPLPRSPSPARSLAPLTWWPTSRQGACGSLQWYHLPWGSARPPPQLCSFSGQCSARLCTKWGQWVACCSPRDGAQPLQPPSSGSTGTSAQCFRQGPGCSRSPSLNLDFPQPCWWPWLIPASLQETAGGCKLWKCTYPCWRACLSFGWLKEEEGSVVLIESVATFWKPQRRSAGSNQRESAGCSLCSMLPAPLSRRGDAGAGKDSAAATRWESRHLGSDAAPCSCANPATRRAPSWLWAATGWRRATLTSWHKHLVLSCRSWGAPEADAEAPNQEIYPSWQLLQQHLPTQWSHSVWTAQLGPCNEPSQGRAAAGCALVHTLVTPTFYLRSWAPALQTHQDHPSAPDRQLAPSPVYSSTGKTTTLQWKQPWERAEGAGGGHCGATSIRSVPGRGHPCGVGGRDGAGAGLYLHGAIRKPHRLRHARGLQGFLGFPHTLPGQNRPSCGSMWVWNMSQGSRKHQEVRCHWLRLLWASPLYQETLMQPPTL